MPPAPFTHSLLHDVLVKTLDFPDRHHLNAAQGWLALGNLAEALAEARCISLLGRVHEETFLVRWHIANTTGNWSEALRIAEIFTRTNSHRPTGWLCRAYSLSQLRRPLEAWILLASQTSVFPAESAIPYLLAWLADRSGNSHLTQHYLARSAALGGPETLGHPLPFLPQTDLTPSSQHPNPPTTP